MATPYNTGKVKIGRGYTYTQRPSMDADDLMIQRALLEPPVSIWKAIAGWVFISSCCIGLAAAMIAGLSS